MEHMNQRVWNVGLSLANFRLLPESEFETVVFHSPLLMNYLF